MKTQHSRNSHQSLKDYSSVLHQQGRMLTDSDLTEQALLSRDKLNEVLRNVVGSGTPKHDGIIVLDEHTGAVSMHWGRAYVDGVLAIARSATQADDFGPFDYDDQLDFPEPPSLPQDQAYRWYLDVWERTVNWLEDDQLRDPALHGADTTARTQTMAQIKWCPLAIDPLCPDVNPAIGDARLKLVLRSFSTSADPCDPCAEELELKDPVGNYLFRVEVHDVLFDDNQQAQEVTLKWSSENGAEAYKTADVPPDFAHSNYVYEYFDTLSEKRLGNHLAVDNANVRVIDGQRHAIHSQFSATSADAKVFVRRWDGWCKIRKTAGNWEVFEGQVGSIDLASGVSAGRPGHIVQGGDSVHIELRHMTLQLELADYAIVAGDYWTVPVRENIHQPGDVLLADDTGDGIAPEGEQHHYLRLLDVAEDGTVQIPSDSECDIYQACNPYAFPSLTDLHAKDVCYDNQVCNMPGADTVQDALDYLCQKNDIEFHNKHLHGWGIVCGLIVECCPKELADDAGENATDRAKNCEHTVHVSAGYAINCEGQDLILKQAYDLNIIEEVAALEVAGEKVLVNGDGSVCLRIDRGADKQPVISVEPYSAAKHKKNRFEGTLLYDFYQEYVVELVDILRSELSITDREDIDRIEEEKNVLVSQERRKSISLLNLLIQLRDQNDGRHVFISKKEYQILHDFYLRLKKILASKTFCAMFAEDNFPEYPLSQLETSTTFGKNWHTQSLLDAEGKYIYTYGQVDNTINVYSVADQKLIHVEHMPTADGAQITALTFSADGKSLYAAANIANADTILGRAQVSHKRGVVSFKWEQSTILCDIYVCKMVTAPEQNADLIYATALNKGLYRLTPELLFANNKTQLKPLYQFQSAGHVAIDFSVKPALAYCSASTFDANLEPQNIIYNQVLVCNLAVEGQAITSQINVPLFDTNEKPARGEDGLVLANGALCVAASQDRIKKVLVYALPMKTNAFPIKAIDVQNTQLAMAYLPSDKKLLLTYADSNWLHIVGGKDAQGITRAFPAGDDSLQREYYPVQIQPSDVIVDKKGEHVFVLNYMSNTITTIPRAELNLGREIIKPLVSYRTEVLQAYYRLFGNLAQYLKDSFCHHILVKCPTCDDDNIIYLATVEIRDKKVFKICNFDKRKYVKSLPTLEYWLSAIPIMPLIKEQLSKICCAVLPQWFEQHREEVIVTDEVATEVDDIHLETIKAKKAKTGIADTLISRRAIQGARLVNKSKSQIYQRQIKNTKILSGMQIERVLNFLDDNQSYSKGVSKQGLLHTPTENALTELEKNHIKVAEVVEYDHRQAHTYVKDYTATPQKIPPGSEVTIVQKDGNVMHYVLKPVAQTSIIDGVSEELKKEISGLEARKTSLANMTTLKAELAQVEARMKSFNNLETIETDISTHQASMDAMQAKFAGMQSRLNDMHDQGAAEEVKLTEMQTLKAAFAKEVDVLNEDIAELGNIQSELSAMRAEKTAMASELSAMRANVNEIKELRVQEEARLKEVAELKTNLSTDLTKLSDNMLELSEMRKSLVVEVNSVRPLKELDGINQATRKKLAAVGVRTIGELAKIDVAKLSVEAKINKNTLRSIMKKAQGKIKM